MFGLGSGEVIVVLVVMAVLFGGKRLPELGRGLGQGMRGFRDALKGIDEPDAGGKAGTGSAGADDKDEPTAREPRP